MHPEVIKAVADWIGDEEPGRKHYPSGCYDPREFDECKDMAQFAATCRVAREVLKCKLEFEAECAEDNAREARESEERFRKYWATYQKLWDDYHSGIPITEEEYDMLFTTKLMVF